MPEPINEFRKDPISGDWVLLATQRAKRPGEHKSVSSLSASETPTCPFDDPRGSGQEVIAECAKKNGHPWITVITNKYPAVNPGDCQPVIERGPVYTTAANGFHEVVITADHRRGFSEFDQEETKLVFRSFQDRYRAIAHYACAAYIQIFNNSGPEAGASIFHPHSQILSTPIIPPRVTRSLNGAAGFYLKHNYQRAHQLLLEWEQAEKKRIVFQNEGAVAYCPFASKTPYEIKILPREPQAYFERADDRDLEEMAEALRFCLRRLRIIFGGELAFNFFIHTAPVKEKGLFPFPCRDFYQWHIEILPHFSKLAGFDFSTGILVNIIDPDRAAEEIRGADLSS